MVDKKIIKEIRSAIKANDSNSKRPKRFLGFFVEYKIDGIEQSPIYHYN